MYTGRSSMLSCLTVCRGRFPRSIWKIKIHISTIICTLNASVWLFGNLLWKTLWWSCSSHPSLGVSFVMPPSSHRLLQLERLRWGQISLQTVHYSEPWGPNLREWGTKFQSYFSHRRNWNIVFCTSQWINMILTNECLCWSCVSVILQLRSCPLFVSCSSSATAGTHLDSCFCFSLVFPMGANLELHKLLDVKCVNISSLQMSRV